MNTLTQTQKTEPAASQFQQERETVERLSAGRAQIEAELSKVIVGQKVVIDLFLIALFAGGHFTDKLCGEV